MEVLYTIHVSMIQGKEKFVPPKDHTPQNEAGLSALALHHPRHSFRGLRNMFKQVQRDYRVPGNLTKVQGRGCWAP